LHHHPYDSGALYGRLAQAGTIAAPGHGRFSERGRLYGRRQLTGIALFIAGLVLLGLA
jgi:hypothetical protein